MKKLLSYLLLASAVMAAAGYHVIQTIHIGGGGSWDYLTLDNAARHLYVSNGTRAVVLDIDAGKVIGEIPDTQGIHGIAIVPELGRGFTSNGRSNNVTIFDLKTLKPLQQVATGQNPDSIIFEPKTGRVFTFNGRSNDSTAIDAKTGQVAGTFPMGGKPEFSVVDGSGRIYVNIEDTSEIAVVDAQKMTVAKRYSLAPCDGPSGLAMDVKNRRLFSVCGNRMMAVSDPDSGKVIATPAIGPGPDGAGFDPGVGLAFSSNGGDGTLTVVGEVKGKYDVVETVPTARGSRTMTVDPKLHRVYLPAVDYAPPAAGQQPKARGGRAPAVPDSFHLLVVGG
jgi:DNA-binding beta-propeller fold protein YncE